MVSGNTTYALVGEDQQQPHVLDFASGRAAVYSRGAPGKESPNEDAACLIEVDDQRGVLVVADGCGGLSSGDVASRIAVESLRRSVAAMPKNEATLRAAILDGIERANQRVCELGTGAATTLAAATLEGDRIRTYHVGDSQVLLVGNRGKIKLQTRSHSPVGYAVEAGVISEEEAIHHEDRHIVSNVVGTLDTHIEIGPQRKLSARDTLLIASDGLFDNLHVDEIVEIIRKGALESAADELVACVDQRMANVDRDHPSKPDDLTFVLFRLGR